MAPDASGPAGGLGELHDMGDRTVELLRLTWKGFRAKDPAALAEARPLRRALREQERALAEARVTDGARLFVPLHLERIGSHAESLAEAIGTLVTEGVPFTDGAVREVNALFERAIELVECARDGVLTGNRVLLRHVLAQGIQHAQLADDYVLAHQRRLVEGLCIAEASAVYLALVDALKGVEAHTRQIAQTVAAAREPA